VAVAAPGPVFGILDQGRLYGIAVDVAELFGELFLGEDVEVVITRLPELRAVTPETL